jgi:DNA-binding PadR family transcriptional regulator
MAAIDLIVLGMLRKESLSAYDIQKLIEFRRISRWVKISTPSIYKKVLSLEEKGFIKAKSAKEGRAVEKAVYSITEAGKREFERLMLEVSSEPINIFLDFNAVIVNLDYLPAEEQLACLTGIEDNIKRLKAFLKDNISEKKDMPGIPETGYAVLQQQYMLAQAIDKWFASLRAAPRNA